MDSFLYPEEIDCVYNAYTSDKGNIYLGNYSAALNLITLQNYNIKAVISVAKGTFLKHKQTDLPNYLYIPADDIQTFDISKYFEQTYAFMQKNLKKSNVYVHCVAGISRSATIVIAYLMKKKGKGLVDIYSLIKKKRDIINPNRGFIKLLRNYENQLKTQSKIKQRSKSKDSSFISRKSVQLKKQKQFSKKTLQISQIESNATKKDQSLLQYNSNIPKNNNSVQSKIQNLLNKFYQSSRPKRGCRRGSQLKLEQKNLTIMTKGNSKINFGEQGIILSPVNYDKYRPKKIQLKQSCFNFDKLSNQKICLIQS